MQKVLLDTNFLLVPVQFGVDVFSELRDVIHGEYSLATSQMVVYELMRLAAGRSKDAGAARVALKLIKDKNVAVEPSMEKVDEWLRAEGKKGAIVCTNDAGLMGRLKMAKARCIRMKGKFRLEFG